jgi:NAD+--asparagine ADP-ribosyltransferase
MSNLLNNLKAKYENEINISKTNIEMFLASPQGVAEHIDFAETVEKELEKIAHAHDMIEALEQL